MVLVIPSFVLVINQILCFMRNYLFGGQETAFYMIFNVLVLFLSFGLRNFETGCCDVMFFTRLVLLNSFQI